jgi:type III secretory pathway component EscT
MRPELTRHRDQHLSKATAAAIGHLRPPATLAKFLIVGGIPCVINRFALFLLCNLPIPRFLPAKDTQVKSGLFNHSEIRLLLSSALALEWPFSFSSTRTGAVPSETERTGVAPSSAPLGFKVTQ